jgi:DNA-binding response OmpR family regulator
MENTRRYTSILVVEDEPIVALDLELELRELGFGDVRLAFNLTSGFQLFRIAPPACGILDVNIGRELVYPLAAEFRRHDIPFLFLTSMTPSQIPAEWRDYPILPKPFGRHSLVRALAMMDVLPSRREPAMRSATRMVYSPQS